MTGNRVLMHVILVFISAFFLIYALYVGLPYDFNADLVRDPTVTSPLTYSKLISYTLTPATPAWSYYSRIEELRPFRYVLHKFFLETFHADLASVHIFVAVGHGLLAVAFFLITYWITRRKLYSWLMVLLYASFPTNAVSLLGFVSLEMQYLFSALTLLAMAALIYLTWNPSVSIVNRALLILTWLAITWLAIKWKSSEKILPFAYLLFLVLNFLGRRRIRLKPFLLLLLVNLAMFFLVIPMRLNHPEPLVAKSLKTIDAYSLKSFQKKEKQTVDFRLANLVESVVALPGTKNPLFTFPSKEQPSSFTGNLGFFLGWAFWLGLLLSPLLLKYAGRSVHLNVDHAEPFQARIHAMRLNLAWFFLVLTSFSSSQVPGDVRYLNFALVPAVVLMAFLIRLVHDALIKHTKARRLFSALITTIFLFTLFRNYTFLVKWVGHFGGLQHSLYESDALIYRKFYKEEPRSLLLLQRHVELEDRVVLVSWYDWGNNWFEKAEEKLKRERVLFVKVRQEDDEKLEKFRQAGYRVDKLKSFPFYDAKPLFFQFSKLLIQMKLKHFKNLQVVLYQVT